MPTRDAHAEQSFVGAFRDCRACGGNTGELGQWDHLCGDCRGRVRRVVHRLDWLSQHRPDVFAALETLVDQLGGGA